ncbi:VOC family protein [Mycolicibacterium chubuense]|nr:VOC family protein [Mycolicibacterium chubuense]
MMSAHLTAFICYRDPEAAVGWISDVLGFHVVRTYRDGGLLAHAELRRGDAVVCVQRDDRGYEVPEPKGDCVGSGLYVVLDAAEVDAVHERATTAGTTVLIAPETTRWGNFRIELLDPEGRQWSIGTYLPGVGDGE